mmetsp:Transcript_21117/g.54949  ORF Transcript_21117/g.54949 Transcript_21117/m.54949 type:complete len:214 (+) Transcript_21117:79-720(+)
MSAQRLVELLKQQPSAQYFLSLPPRETDPEFYEEVKTPISLAEIGANAAAGQYATAEAVREDFALMLQNTRDLDGADAVSARVKDSHELEKAFDRVVASLAQPADASDGGLDRKRKAEDKDAEAGKAAAPKAGEAEVDGGATSAPVAAGESAHGDPADPRQPKKKAKRETEEEIRALHRTGGNATMLAERQDCSLHWLRKLMGYKDREYTELR